MRFIRVHGRVVPVKDGSANAQKALGKKAYGTAQKAGSLITAGAVSIGGAMVAHNIGKNAHHMSNMVGKSAITSARAAQGLLRQGNALGHAAKKGEAVRLAKASLALGKMGNAAKTLSKGLVGAGIGLGVAGLGAGVVAANQIRKSKGAR